MVVVDLCFEGQEDDGLVLMDWVSDQFPETPVVVLSSDSLTGRVLGAVREKTGRFHSKNGRL